MQLYTSKRVALHNRQCKCDFFLLETAVVWAEFEYSNEPRRLTRISVKITNKQKLFSIRYLKGWNTSTVHFRIPFEIHQRKAAKEVYMKRNEHCSERKNKQTCLLNKKYTISNSIAHI